MTFSQIKQASRNTIPPNSDAIANQFTQKKYFVMHPSRLTASHLDNTTIHKEHIYDDPSLYKLAGHTRYQKDEIVMLEGDTKMIPGVVTQANHPNYQININGNNFTIDSTITSVFSALTPSTSVILNHQRYYQNATKPRLQVGDTAMYNEGNKNI